MLLIAFEAPPILATLYRPAHEPSGLKQQPGLQVFGRPPPSPLPIPLDPSWNRPHMQDGVQAQEGEEEKNLTGKCSDLSAVQ